MAEPEIVIGIDLGTTNSVVAAVLQGEVHVIPDESGARTQASMVAFMADGTIVVGNEARKEAITDPVNTVYSIKRLIGRSFHSAEIKAAIQQFPFSVVKDKKNDASLIDIRGERYGMAEVSGLILRRMKDIAERYLQRPVSKAVITVPANFDDTQRQMTKLAGSLAGLDIIRVINEPTAAALAYGFGRDMDARIAIYDFGGGTFDITVLDVKADVFEVISTAGDTYLGGDDFDNRLANFMQMAFQKMHNVSLDGQPEPIARLKQVAEKLKRELTTRDRAIVTVHELAVSPAGESLDLRFQVERSSLNERCRDIVQRTFLVCDDALRNAGIRADGVDGVVLVGGSTRMPLVREMVEHYFNRAPLIDINPDEVVAVGAAIQGAALQVDPFAENVAPQPLLLDVTPMSLGVQTVNGMFDVIIKRNATIPCEQTRVFTTTSDGQTAVRLPIFQGESRMAADNTQLGEVELYGLRAASRGEVAIEVTFEIDTNGIVVVTARDRETGMAQATRIAVTAGYSPDDVAALMERGL